MYTRIKQRTMEASTTVIVMYDSWASEMMKQTNAPMRRPCNKRNRICLNIHGLFKKKTKTINGQNSNQNANLITLKFSVLVCTYLLLIFKNNFEIKCYMQIKMHIV